MSTTAYAYAQEFIAKYLGGRFEPLADISGNSGVIKINKVVGESH